jgi:phosphohistidine phosphatase SixA
MTRIMIIRHAEKHSGTDQHGVNMLGEPARHELTVRGWQRSGALVPFFAPANGHPPGSLISTPRTIMASGATKDSPSLRAQHTVQALADLLGVRIDTRFPDEEEMDAAAAALMSPSPVLIAWHHSHIPLIAKLIGGALLPCPDDWPDDCFDVVWVLDRDENSGAWRFSQVVQRLFLNDRVDPI